MILDSGSGAALVLHHLKVDRQMEARNRLLGESTSTSFALGAIDLAPTRPPGRTSLVCSGSPKDAVRAIDGARRPPPRAIAAVFAFGVWNPWGGWESTRFSRDSLKIPPGHCLAILLTPYGSQTPMMAHDDGIMGI